MSSKRPTSTDVAKLAGVSQASVSLILNRSSKTDFTEETKARVYEAAKALGYKVPSHKNTGKNSNRLILVLIPTLTNEYYSKLVQSLEEYADSLGYRILVCSTFRKPEIEHFYLDKFGSEKISGIIYTFLPNYPDEINHISSQLPVVLIGEKSDNLSICSIELNSRKAGSLMGEHLYSLGHRHILYISTSLNQITKSRSQRLEGLREGLASGGSKDGVETSVETMAVTDAKDKDSFGGGRSYEFETGKAMTETFLADPGNITAIVGSNDMIALGIINALQGRGISVPGRYSVCGFDNIFSSSIGTPGLTTIDHKLIARSHSAIDMIIAQDTSEEAAKASELIANKIEFSPSLIIRASSGQAM